MGIAELFKKKDLTEKEFLEREYKKKFKELRIMVLKNPIKIDEYMTESVNLMDEMIQKGIFTEEEKSKAMYQFNKDMEKINKLSRLRR